MMGKFERVKSGTGCFEDSIAGGYATDEGFGIRIPLFAAVWSNQLPGESRAWQPHFTTGDDWYARKTFNGQQGITQ